MSLLRKQVEALGRRFVVRTAKECGFSLVVFEADYMIFNTAVRQQSYTSLISHVYEDIVDDLSTMPYLFFIIFFIKLMGQFVILLDMLYFLIHVILGS